MQLSGEIRLWIQSCLEDNRRGTILLLDITSFTSHTIELTTAPYLAQQSMKFQAR